MVQNSGAIVGRENWKSEKENRTFVFIDMTDSSIQWARSTDPMAEKIAPEFFHTVLETARDFAYIPELTNFTGDGWLLTFGNELKDVVNAVNCGWMIIYKWWNKGGHSFMPRIGIHSGKVYKYSYDKEKYLDPDQSLPFKFLQAGDALNKGARIEAFAKSEENKRWHSSHFSCLISGEIFKKIECLKIKKQNKHYSGPQCFEFEKKKREPKDDFEWIKVYKLSYPVIPKCELEIEKPAYLETVLKSAKRNSKGMKAREKGDLKKAESCFKDAYESLNKRKYEKYLSSIWKRNYGEIQLLLGKEQKSIKIIEDAIVILKDVYKTVESFEFESPHHVKPLADAYYEKAKLSEKKMDAKSEFKKARKYYKQARNRYPFKDPIQSEVADKLEKCGLNI